MWIGTWLKVTRGHWSSEIQIIFFQTDFFTQTSNKRTLLTTVVPRRLTRPRGILETCVSLDSPLSRGRKLLHFLLLHLLVHLGSFVKQALQVAVGALKGGFWLDARTDKQKKKVKTRKHRVALQSISNTTTVHKRSSPAKVVVGCFNIVGLAPCECAQLVKRHSCRRVSCFCYYSVSDADTQLHEETRNFTRINPVTLTHPRVAWQTAPGDRTFLPAARPPLQQVHSDNGLQRERLKERVTINVNNKIDFGWIGKWQPIHL